MQEIDYIYGKTTDARDFREVKVKLPVQLIVALHGVKILKGHTLSDIVTTALTTYFEAGKPPGPAQA